MKTIRTALLLVLMMGIGLKAEIVSTPSSLSIDALYPSLKADMNIGLSQGLLLTGAQPGQAFKIHFPSSADETYPSPSISGNGCISFYWPLYKMKIWIYTRNTYTLSDERAKTDIEPIDGALPMLFATPKASRSADANIRSAREKEYEFLKRVAPGAVTIADGDTIVNYMELVPVLFKAAQELTAQVEQQSEMISQVHQTLNSPAAKAVQLGRIIGCTPNPTNGYFTVNYQIDQKSLGHSWSIRIMDSAGSEVYSKSILIDENTLSVDLSPGPKGVYFVSLNVDNASCDTYRLIKN